MSAHDEAEVADLVEESLSSFPEHQTAIGVSRFVPERGLGHWAIHMIEEGNRPLSYVDPHSHEGEFEFNIFLGDLVVELLLEDGFTTKVAPFMVRIPPSIVHGFTVLRGSGTVLCHRYSVSPHG